MNPVAKNHRNTASYVAVAASAVEDDALESNSSGSAYYSKNGDDNVVRDVETPPVPARVLGVLEETAPISSGPSRNRGAAPPAGGGYESLGIAVAAPAAGSPGDGAEYVKGEVLEPAWNDVWFAVAFLLNVVATAVLAVVLGIPALATTDAKESSNSTQGGGGSQHSSSANTPEASANADDDESGVPALQFFLVLVSIGATWSLLALLLLIRASRTHSEQFVRVAYFGAPALVLASCLALLLAGDNDGITTVWATAGSVWAVLIVIAWWALRKFIPFAAATLRAAGAALQAHPWLVPLSIGSVFTSCAWFVLWGLAFVGCVSRYNSGHKQDQFGDGETSPAEGAIYFGMLFSLYWGFQVIRNGLHFTTAGAVTSWWFFDHPELGSYDGRRAVADSFRRASTYSLGSVCMASLLNTIAQTLESLMNSRSSSDAAGLLGCVLACLLACVRAWLEYFNSFALVYSALYNADYLTSGRQVIQLFRHAGWTTFINDRLVFRVLYMAVFAVGCLTGLTAMALAALLSSTSGSTDLAVVFVAGFVVGLVTCNPLVFLLESASRTIMVCLAEHPSEFAESHPDLFEVLTAGWSAAYPEAWSQQKAISQH